MDFIIEMDFFNFGSRNNSCFAPVFFFGEAACIYKSRMAFYWIVNQSSGYTISSYYADFMLYATKPLCSNKKEIPKHLEFNKHACQ